MIKSIYIGDLWLQIFSIVDHSIWPWPTFVGIDICCRYLHSTPHIVLIYSMATMFIRFFRPTTFDFNPWLPWRPELTRYWSRRYSIACWLTVPVDTHILTPVFRYRAGDPTDRLKFIRPKPIRYSVIPFLSTPNCHRYWWRWPQCWSFVRDRFIRRSWDVIFDSIPTLLSARPPIHVPCC